MTLFLCPKGVTLSGCVCRTVLGTLPIDTWLATGFSDHHQPEDERDRDHNGLRHEEQVRHVPARVPDHLLGARGERVHGALLLRTSEVVNIT